MYLDLEHCADQNILPDMATILLIFVANRNFQLLGNIITDMQLFIMENKELFIVEYLPIHIDSVADPE